MIEILTIIAIAFTGWLLHAYAEKDSALRTGKTRAITAAPLWPVYAVAAAIYLKKEY